jgi:hypothetical protein
MGKESQPVGTEKQGAAERVLRFGRDINALGALAIAGVAVVIPGPNVILAGWAGLNAAQAGGFELLRQKATKSKSRSIVFKAP